MKTYDMTPMVKLMTCDIEPGSLAETLDEVLWRYVDMLLTNATGCRSDSAQVYDLRLLKAALEEVARSSAG